ncbi:family 16 glycosylhydrolase [Gaoshiqia sp. Z1-71]|uniref:family 16 glycosylhydrolase n=1 Tax=Gaoshiqia hydrogeniformans TaxID=3290090 RepID=UPI003BF87215
MQVIKPIFLYSFLILVLFSAANRSRAQQADCLQPVWFDEFDTNGAPSADRWAYDLGGGGWGNNELQTYTDNRSNSWIENGRLFIQAVKTNGNWTSARLVTRQKGDWLYGRIEVKAKLPIGKGTWPAIWMLPTDWEYGGWPASGEIDIMEHVGYDPGVIHGTVHTEAYYHSIGTQKGASTTVPDAQSAFHVYAIEWEPDKIKWYIDDQLYFTFNNEHKTYKEWPFDKRFHLLLNIAVGGNWGAAQGIDPNLTEATMEIDYVRIYKPKLPKPVITGPAIRVRNQVGEYAVDPVEGASYFWHLPEGVSIVNGEGTARITVQWNDVPGDLLLEIRTACETVFSDAFHVDYQFKPESEQLEIHPANFNGELLWKASPGNGNTIDLYHAGHILTVDFQVPVPSMNAFISYDFNGIADLSDHGQMTFDLQVDPNNPPVNLRIDLLDINGNINLSQIFKISQFAADGLYHPYSHEFKERDDGAFRLDQIRQIRIYINTGDAGQSSGGTFQLKNLILQAPDPLPDVPGDETSWIVFPNPAHRQITIQSIDEIRQIQLFSSSGQLVLTKPVAPVKNYQITLGAFIPGVYFLKVNQERAKKIIIY